jgi:predicted metal-binding membrane protein
VREAARAPRNEVPWATFCLAAAAALTIVAVGASPYGRYLHHGYQPPSATGQAGAVALFLAGWALMLLAMMLPTATTLLAAVGRLGHDRVAARRLQLLAGAGFLSTWIVVGYAFRVGDILVHSSVDSIGWLAARPHLVVAATLLVGGAFQFTSLKHRCLTACRTPTGFVYRHWHGGHADRDAVRIGVAYGVSCVGCCWALMLVLFGVGLGNVAWMFALGAVMALEKNTAIGPRVGAPVGVLLIAAAAGVALFG